MVIHKWEPDIYIGLSAALHLQCTKNFQALSLTAVSTTVVKKFNHCRQQHFNAFNAVADSTYNFFTPSALKMFEFWA
jgi:hypothetical protein